MQSASGEAQIYLPHVTSKVPRSIHANFYADWTDIVGAREHIQILTRTHRLTDKQKIFLWLFMLIIQIRTHKCVCILWALLVKFIYNRLYITLTKSMNSRGIVLGKKEVFRERKLLYINDILP